MNKTMNTGNGVVTAGSKKGWLTQEEIEVVKKQFFPPNAKPEEMNYCFEVAKQFNLNPITKQIYFVPRKSQDDNGMWHEKIEPLVGRDGFLAIAHRSGKFGGIESTSTLKEVPKLIDGEWKMTTDLVAIAKVWRTDSQMPFVVEVFYSEYVQRKKWRTNTILGRKASYNVKELRRVRLSVRLLILVGFTLQKKLVLV